MKKRYTFLPANWVRFAISIALWAIIPLSLQAQVIPPKQWDKAFGGTGNDLLTAMKPTTDGGYILGGTSNSPVSGNKAQASKGDNDYWIIKIDANGNKLWEKAFGGSGSDTFRAIEQTADGGYILGGFSNSPFNGDKSQASKGYNDYWVLKIDASGNKLWDKTFGGNADDYFENLKQTTDGGFILGGYAWSGISGDKSQDNKGAYDYWIIKTDANGNKVWDKSLGGLGSDYLAVLKQSPDGGYILGGQSYSNSGGDKSQNGFGTTASDIWIIKTDANGNKLWDKTYGGNGNDGIGAIELTADGGYLVGGASASASNAGKSHASKGGYDFWVLKIDASGNRVWDKGYGGANDDLSYSMQQTADGGILMGGRSYSDISGDKTEPTQGENDYWLVKLDGTGNKLWQKSFGGSENDYLMGAYQAPDGTYLLAGHSGSGITGDKSQNRFGPFGTSDYWLIKLNSNISGVEETETNFNLFISPNPNKGKFYLQLGNFTTPKAEVTVTDLLGRIVLQKYVQTPNNQFSEELTLPNAKGIYLLQLKAGERIISRKIVVEQK